jgi:non-homologous end joining protein Ku
MSELKIQGTIIKIGELKTWDSGFSKVEFVINTAEQYPQDVKFEIVKEKAEQFLKYNKVDDAVDVSFNVRGNEYEGKFYVNLQAWKVFKTDELQSAAVEPTKAEEKPSTDEDDDLPF